MRSRSGLATVWTSECSSSETTARTSAAPADWEPLPRGPQNLRVTTTHDSIIVHWDPPFPEAPGRWFVGVSTIFNGTAWSVAQRTIRTPLPAEGVTLRGDPPALIRPNTTYTVLVAHRGFDGAAAEISVTTPAAPPALRLTLAAERAECTAGTLNPVTWEITGGAAPYRLTVDGASVDADADQRARRPAGPCRTTGSGCRSRRRPGTITATVTDATGAPATASAAYTIVPPLPAPETPGAIGVHPESLSFRWYTAERPPGAEALVAFLVRWREVGTAAWTYEAQPPYRRVGFAYGALAYFDGLRDPVAYEAAVAPMRHPLEAETPAALRWTPARQATTLTYAANVTVTTTHDTVTVRWDRQPSATYWYVGVSNADTLASTRILPTDAAAWGDPASGTHEVTLRHLSPDTEYRLRVATGRSNEGRTTRRVDVPVRTKPAPAGSTPLPRGPQNLRATSTATTITVTWDPPFAEAKQNYRVYIYAPGGDVYPGGFRLHRDALYAPPWTFTFGVPSAAQFPLAPGITYRIRVVHDGIVRGETEILIATQARAAPPLGLTLAAERAECTAATLNPVSWEIEGGVGPYRLTVDGEPVDADAESATVTCGALRKGATEAPGTITALVKDAAGAWVSASAAYTIVPPLPAPETAGENGVYPDTLTFYWYTAEPPPGGAALVAFLLRWREVGTVAWTYEAQAPWRNGRSAYGAYAHFDGLRDPVAYEAAVAPMRHPLEAETPAALRWTPARQATTVTYPANVTVTTTHDTVTVRWDRQPSVTYWEVSVDNADGLAWTRISATDAAAWGDPASGTHEVTFRHLSPDTEYELGLGSGRSSEDSPTRDVEVSVRTKPVPAGSTPLPRGPQNLRATSTATTITVTWDPPFAEAKQNYRVYIHAPGGDVYPGGFRLHRDALYAPPWTFTFGVPSAAQLPLAPGITYRIRVVHDGIVRVETEISIATQARAAPPLRLTLTASRAECTAGTPNPVTWEIEGGGGPYRLTVDGASVEAEAESVTVTCGALPDYGIWLPVTEAPGTIPATVTDATGAPATASAAYTIVPPLPAPENVSARGLRTYAVADWDSVSAASGSVHYILRWKRTAASDWTYEHEFEFLEYEQGARRGWYSTRLPEGTAFEMAVAVMRNPIERQTPEALTWSARVSFATVTDPQNVVVTSTHDTITVTWDVGAGDQGVVWVSSAEGSKDPKTTTIADGQVRAEFTGLLPDTEYTISIRTLEVEDEFQAAGASAQVRTKPAPPDWVPLPTGPKNLRVTATHDTITATWDPPHADADPSYRVLVTDVETGERAYYPVVITRTDYVLENLQASRSYEVQVTHYGATIAGETRTVVTMPAPTSALTCIEYLVGAVICT